MAQEKRNLSALDVNNGVTWTNQTNAYVEDDNYASSGNNEFVAVGEYCGGNYQDSQGTPTALDDFKVRFFDINSDHSNDTFDLEVYNPDTTSWESLETFNSGNLFPTALTTKDYTSAMQTKFSAATNKTAFLDGLQLRIYMTTKSAGADKPEIGLAWSNFTYTYSGATPVPLDGTIPATSSVVADLSVAKEITGTVTATSAADADLSADKKLAGPVTATSAADAVLSVALKLTGTIAATSGVSGDLSADKKLTGTIAATSTVDGDLTVPGVVALDGVITATSGAVAKLAVARGIAGTIAASSSVAAELTVPVPLTGTVAAVSAMAGDIEVAKQLSGVIQATSSVAGIIGVGISLIGDISAVSAVAGVLTIPSAGSALPAEWAWIADLINDEGRPMAITLPGKATDWRGNPAKAPVGATGVMVKYKAIQIDHDQIKRADKKVLLAPMAAIDVEDGTKIIDSLDGSTWTVIHVKKISERSDILLYVLQVRQ